MNTMRHSDPYGYHSDVPTLSQTVSVTMELYQSMRGEYFVGYADDLVFGNGTSAWARLYNPHHSGVNLHVNVWTVTDISAAPFRAQFWFNATAMGTPVQSPTVSANTALTPLPRSRIELQSASQVPGEPMGGVKAFSRRGQPESTLVETENGKFIFPPGGNFMVFVSLAETPNISATGRVGFGWWEEPISGGNCY